MVVAENYVVRYKCVYCVWILGEMYHLQWNGVFSGVLCLNLRNLEYDFWGGQAQRPTR